MDGRIYQEHKEEAVMADIFVNLDDLDPNRPYPNLGPVFTATYACPCSYCDEEIQDGDQIRADGFGNWIHADCASFANGE